MQTDIINNSAANIDTNNFGFLTTPEIYDFREFYRLDKIIRQPKLLQIEQNVSLRGEVIAAKGPIIILRDRFHFFAVNAHQLLGREIKIAPNMMPESSCGAFS
jgi:hypothetical protein